MKTIVGLDATLVKQFLEREALDYGGNYDVKEVLKRIKKEIKHISKKFDYLVLVSVGNTGVELRRLVVSPVSKYWNWKNGDCTVILCNCGKINHWGYVRIEKKDKK